MRKPRCHPLALLALALGACASPSAPAPAHHAATSTSRDPGPRRAPPVEGPNEGATTQPVPSPLEVAAERAADYLTRQCLPDGRFVYRRHLDPKITPRPSYNVLRHAGAIYALAAYQKVHPKAEVAACLGRATSHLWSYVRPLDETDPQSPLAVWSAKDPSMAKLGGAGLTLVALGGVGALVDVGAKRQDGLRIAAFIRLMQQPDGGFASKYFADRGPDTSWTSLYYPGEAALGLVMLDDPEARSTAERALDFLARSRAGQPRVPPDHWALIATEALLRRPRPEAPAVAPGLSHRLLDHARQVVDSILAAVGDHAPESPFAGSFGADGRTTPTATRLEGLLAARRFLTREVDAARREAIDEALADGIAFLMRTQRPDGAMPRRAAWRADDAGPRAGEVRIDYVQHALSAYLGYEALVESGQNTKKLGRFSR